MSASDRDHLRIDLLSEDAMKTSAIEGEMLDRLSVQSSLRRHLGLAPDSYPTKPREQGVSQMMVDVYSNYSKPLSHDTLFRWQKMLLSHNRQLETMGAYWSQEDAMQIGSGTLDRPTVHFEAPPSHQVLAETDQFVTWFNRIVPNGPEPLRALIRAGLSHLYFESIHAFEGGNGRLARALGPKSLSQNIGQTSLIALAFTIERERKAYYDQLERHQKTLDVTSWLAWFAETVLTAQQVTLDRVGFFISKTHFYDRHRDQFNARQSKATTRLIKVGPDGLKRGGSAPKTISRSREPRAPRRRGISRIW